MRILIACEFSARVRDAFRDEGHEAYSCDLLPSESDAAWHFRQDVREVMPLDWDMMIAFPPCTDLAASGAQHWPAKRADGRQAKAAAFFMEFVNATHIPLRAIENPRGIMSRLYRKPDQYVHPFWFGEPAWKQTGLWLFGLDPLWASDRVEPVRHLIDSRNSGRYARGARDPTERSRISPAIANAMAWQWGRAVYPHLRGSI